MTTKHERGKMALMLDCAQKICFVCIVGVDPIENPIFNRINDVRIRDILHCLDIA